MFHRLSLSNAFLGSVRAGILKENLISIVNGMRAEPDGPLRSNLTRLGLAVYSRSAVPARDMRVQPTESRTSGRCAVTSRPEAGKCLTLVLKARDEPLQVHHAEHFQHMARGM